MAYRGEKNKSFFLFTETGRAEVLDVTRSLGKTERERESGKKRSEPCRREGPQKTTGRKIQRKGGAGNAGEEDRPQLGAGGGKTKIGPRAEVGGGSRQKPAHRPNRDLRRASCRTEERKPPPSGHPPSTKSVSAGGGRKKRFWQITEKGVVNAKGKACEEPRGRTAKESTRSPGNGLPQRDNPRNNLTGGGELLSLGGWETKGKVGGGGRTLLSKGHKGSRTVWTGGGTKKRTVSKTRGTTAANGF